MSNTQYANDILTGPTTIVAEECYLCGVVFGLDGRFREQRLQDQRNFYCPNGHGQQYCGKTEAQKEKERADRLQQRLEWADARAQSWKDQAHAADYAARAAKGKLTKVKKRIANGVCPCCNRTFQDLGRHMAGQHPEYADGVR